MKNDENFQKLEQLVNNACSAVEVVCNSCYYKDDYAGGNILDIAKNNLEQMFDIISDIEYGNIEN